MESHDQSHLLLCNKEDLVKYILELRERDEETETRNNQLREELNRFPENSAGYTQEEFQEMVNVMEDITEHTDYDNLEIEEDRKKWETEIYKENDKLNKDITNMTRKFNQMKQSRDKYRTENEKLKNNTKFFGGVDWNSYNLFAYDKWCKYYNEKISPYMEGGKASPKKYVEHLEESNEKLKDKIGDLDWSLVDAITQKDIAIEERNNGYTNHSENEKLKQENQELFEELENMKKRYICIPGEYLIDE